MSDADIQAKLQLRESTYYFYRKRLYDQHAEVFKRLSPTDLAFHISVYREKMNRHASFLEAFINNAVQSEDSEKIRQIAAISAEYQAVRMNLLKLESESLAVITNHEARNQTNGYRTGPQSLTTRNVHEGSGAMDVLPSVSTTNNFSQRKF